MAFQALSGALDRDAAMAAASRDWEGWLAGLSEAAREAHAALQVARQASFDASALDRPAAMAAASRAWLAWIEARDAS